MKSKRMFSYLLFVIICALPFHCQQSSTEFDLVILNGKIVDGSGNPWYQADIGIREGHITQIGKLDLANSKKTIDATNQIVAPGFIDVHTHADRKIADQTEAINYLLQGVTTIIGGNCGGSQYPLKELFSKLERSGIALNFASLIGHNTIRRRVMQNENREPTAEELSKMKNLVKQEMEAGAIGFSTGLAYVPGRYSKTEEIIELVKMVHTGNGVYATHMRNQGIHIKEAIEEAIRIGREAEVPVEISHIKLANETVWGQYDLITEPIEKARQQGLEIYMDQYPYTATSSGFGSSFPGWAVAGSHQDFLQRLNDPVKYDRIKKAIIKRRLFSPRGIDKLKKIYVAKNINHSEYEGKNLSEILELIGKEKTISNGADLIINMEKNDQPRGIFFQMAEDDVAELMKKSYNMIASDGKIEIPSVETPHPRAYGTFPRVLAKYVRELNVLTLSDAIRKMSALPAQAMHLYDRGVLKPGSVADIVIFDKDKIRDAATFDDPHQYPKGIHWVIVNGKVAAQDGEVVTGNAGKILYGAERVE